MESIAALVCWVEGTERTQGGVHFDLRPEGGQHGAHPEATLRRVLKSWLKKLQHRGHAGLGAFWADNAADILPCGRTALRPPAFVSLAPCTKSGVDHVLACMDHMNK